MESIQKSIIIYSIASYLILAAACFQLISSVSLIAIAGISLLFIIPLRRFGLDHSEYPPLTGTQKKALFLSLLAVLIFFFACHDHTALYARRCHLPSPGAQTALY